MSGKRVTIGEVQSMLPSLGVAGGWKVAKAIVEHAAGPPEVVRAVVSSGSGRKCLMAQAEAARIVERANERIALADAVD